MNEITHCLSLVEILRRRQQVFSSDATIMISGCQDVNAIPKILVDPIHCKTQAKTGVSVILLQHSGRQSLIIGLNVVTSDL